MISRCGRRGTELGRGSPFRTFANYRIRALLHAEKPNWDLLTNITPR